MAARDEKHKRKKKQLVCSCLSVKGATGRAVLLCTGSMDSSERAESGAGGEGRHKLGWGTAVRTLPGSAYHQYKASTAQYTVLDAVCTYLSTLTAHSLLYHNILFSLGSTVAHFNLSRYYESNFHISSTSTLR